MNTIQLTIAQLGLWNDKRGFRAGLIAGVSLMADSTVSMITVTGPDDAVLEVIVKTVKWRKS